MADRPDNQARMTLGEHLEELRKRLIYALAGLAAATAACLYFAPTLIAILKAPYVDVMQRYGMSGDLAVLNVTSGFSVYMKIAVYSGLVVSSPWVFYQLWLFVAAGLYNRERRCVMMAVPFSAALFICGAVFFLLAVAKPALLFFIGVSKWLGVTPIITFENHVRFMTELMVLFGLAFQTPLLVFVLGATGLVQLKTLNHYRRHVIVIILVLAGIMTPPDPINQTALAIPMWLLYELGVLLVYLHKRRKARPEQDRAG